MLRQKIQYKIGNILNTHRHTDRHTDTDTDTHTHTHTHTHTRPDWKYPRHSSRQKIQHKTAKLIPDTLFKTDNYLCSTRLEIPKTLFKEKDPGPSE